jgi:hypothetical protein
MEELRSLEDLLELQQVDSEIDRLLDRRGALPELDEYRSADEDVKTLTTRIDEAALRVRELDLGSDKASGELGLAEEKLTAEERRLYAGGLSARDAEHLRNEVEMLRRQISEREDETLALMEEREQVQAAHESLAAELAAAQKHKTEVEAAIKQEWAGIDAEVARLEQQKEEIVPRIDPDLLELYDDLRLQKDGVAVATFIDRVCGGCHLTHSAAEEVQVFKATPPRCSHCRRILVSQ